MSSRPWCGTMLLGVALSFINVASHRHKSEALHLVQGHVVVLDSSAAGDLANRSSPDKTSPRDEGDTRHLEGQGAETISDRGVEQTASDQTADRNFTTAIKESARFNQSVDSHLGLSSASSLMLASSSNHSKVSKEGKSRLGLKIAIVVLGVGLCCGAVCVKMSQAQLAQNPAESESDDDAQQSPELPVQNVMSRGAAMRGDTSGKYKFGDLTRGMIAEVKEKRETTQSRKLESKKLESKKLDKGTGDWLSKR